MNIARRPLTPEQKEVKNLLALDCYKLGAVLVLYQIMTYVFNYVYYLAVYIYYNGSFTLNVNEAMSYLRSNEKIITSTSFRMAGNISVTFLSLTVAMLLMHIFFKGQLGGWMKPTKQGVRTGLLWAAPNHVVNMFSTMVVTFLVDMLSSGGITVPTSDFTIVQPSKAAVLLQIAYVIIAAPMIEEILYRGMILSVLSKYGKMPAILISALCFGLMHGNIPQAAGAFIGGLIYAAIAVESRSIVPSIILHIFNNLLAELSDITEAMGLKNSADIVAIVLIAAAFVGLVIGFVCIRQLYIKEEENVLTPSQVRTEIFTNPAIIACLCIFVGTIISGLVKAN